MVTMEHTKEYQEAYDKLNNPYARHTFDLKEAEDYIRGYQDALRQVRALLTHKTQGEIFHEIQKIVDNDSNLQQNNQ
mgnify:CR=1 FL=1